MFEKLLQFFVRLLPKPLKKLYDKYEELIVYIYYGLLTTIVNTIVQFGVEFGLLNFVAWSPRVENFLSTSLAWITAALFAFYVNKKYVFKSERNSAKALLWEFSTFVSGRLLTGLLAVGIMQIGVGLYMREDDTKNIIVYSVFYLAQQVIVTLTNYAISKLIVFRKKKDMPGQEDT